MEDKRIHGMGKQKAIHLSPELIAGETFNADAKMHIWASADQKQNSITHRIAGVGGFYKSCARQSKRIEIPI